MQKKKVLINNKWLKVIKEDLTLPNKKVISNFFTVERPSYSAVLPIINLNSIILVEQYRHGSRRKILNVPMGINELNESPEETAKRELEEETGYVANTLHRLGTFENAPSFLRLKCHLFLATNIEKSVKKISKDAQEETKTKIIPLEEGLQKISDGSIQDMTTIISILNAKLIISDLNLS